MRLCSPLTKFTATASMLRCVLEKKLQTLAKFSWMSHSFCILLSRTDSHSSLRVCGLFSSYSLDRTSALSPLFFCYLSFVLSSLSSLPPFPLSFIYSVSFFLSFSSSFFPLSCIHSLPSSQFPFSSIRYVITLFHPLSTHSISSTLYHSLSPPTLFSLCFIHSLRSLSSHSLPFTLFHFLSW
jgi:hypothetical protein